MPNMAVIEELKSHKDIDLLYVGSDDGVEKGMIEKIGVRYEGVKCGKLRRYFSWKNFKDLLKVPVGIWQARRVLKEFGADVVFAKGGYVSVPVVIAAKKLGVPVILHESDLSPGLANKICLKYSDKFCVSFEESKSHVSKKHLGKIVYTGALVRDSVLWGTAEAGRKFTGLNAHRPVILVMGGSQGAMQINDLVRASLDELLKKFQIVHIAGRGNLDIGIKRPGYVQYEFLEEQIKDVYEMSEMVITRGGANSLFEIAILKKKALIIPLGTEGSRGEQWQNAQLFASKMGWSVLGGKITRTQLIDAIKLTFDNKLPLDYKIENGVKKVVDLILKTTK
jgi:UDP-N-acetylglucosamine--N-acetylmuramyl-(pentapeptide) pyrophosphoryl-undecaprenol N-acetylglucosamine transferase